MPASDTAVMLEIALPVSNTWSHVELLRTSVLACLQVMFQNSDFCHSVGMVAGELLENAVKYGDWSAPKGAFRMRVFGGTQQVTIEVCNPVQPQSPDAQAVLDTLRWLQDMPSAAVAYSQKLRDAARANGTTSHLGLVRIAYEGGCALSASLNDASVLQVRAVCRLP